MYRLFIFCLTLNAIFLSPVEGSPRLTTSNKGIQIDAGSAGKFALPVPGLRRGSKDYSGEKPSVEVADSGSVVATYPSGAKLTMGVVGNTVECVFSGIPNDAIGFIFTTQIPMSFSNGGRFSIGKQPLQPFPPTKDKQVVEQGTATDFTLVDPMNEGFRIISSMGFQQLQDNRVFGWPVFMYIYNFSFQRQSGITGFTFRFEELDKATVNAEPVQFRVDRYGQSARKEFANKVKSDDELKADIEKQRAADATPCRVNVDIFGGVAGSGEKFGLKKTGFFHVGDAEDRKVLVTPEGNMFFHLAACGINITDDYTLVAGREKTYEWIPPQDATFGSAWRPKTPGVVSFYIANWIKKFGKPFTMEEWSGQVVTRMRSWGFNSGGAFSVQTDMMRAMNFPYVASLPLGKAAGVTVLPDKVGAAELIDPFAPGIEDEVDRAFAKSVDPKANDPLLIGWFQGNEQHFELLPKIIPAYKASKVAAKANLVQMLADKYGDIAKFNAAWNPVKPFASFDDLKESPLFIRTEAGAEDMTDFYRRYLETYYSLVTRVFHKHDPHHLLIGNRLTPGTANNEDVIRIGGKYLDVISLNYYTYPIESGFLKQVYDWSGRRPIILSEWYYAATDTGLGGGKEVASQTERAKAYRNYVEQAAALPYVVGSEWFCFTDQSITGRFFEGFNGEGNNTGLINVADRPYEELVAATKQTGERLYDVMFGKESPFVFDDPRFTGRGVKGGNRVVSAPRALSGLKLDGSTTNWPGRPAEPIESGRLVSGVPDPKLRGDFRLCWDNDNLYFLIHVKDATPCKNDKEPKNLWNADCVELFVGGKEINKGGTMNFSDRHILIGAGKEPKIFIVDQPDSTAGKVVVIPDVTGDGYVMDAAIPWKTLGIGPQAGMELLFDVAVDNSDDGLVRKQQLMWNGTAKNPNDRGAWGRARIIEN